MSSHRNCTKQEGEQDLVLGGRGGAIHDWHLLGGKELVGDLLGTDVKIDPTGLLIVSILCPADIYCDMVLIRCKPDIECIDLIMVQ